MAGNTVKAMLQIQGDHAGAMKSVQAVVRAMQSAGASAIKVTDNVVTDTDAKLRHIQDLQDRVVKAQQRVTAVKATKAAAPAQIKASDQREANLKAILVSKSDELKRAELDLARAQRDRGEATKRLTTYGNMLRMSDQALAQAENRLAEMQRAGTFSAQELAAQQGVVDQERQRNLALQDRVLAASKRMIDADQRFTVAEQKVESALQQKGAVMSRVERATERLALANREAAQAEQLTNATRTKATLDQANHARIANELATKDAQLQARLAAATTGRQRSNLNLSSSFRQLQADVARLRTEEQSADAQSKQSARDYAAATQNERSAIREVTVATQELNRAETVTAQTKEKIAREEGLQKTRADQLKAAVQGEERAERQVNIQRDLLYRATEKMVYVTGRWTQATQAQSTVMRAGITFLNLTARGLFAAAQAGGVFVRFLGQTRVVGSVTLAIQNLVRHLGNVTRGFLAAHPNVSRFVQILARIGPAATVAVSVLGRLVAVMGAVGRGSAAVGRSLLGMLGGFGKLGGMVARLIPSMLGIGKAGAQGFGTVGTHLAGLAVRLQGAQMGMYAIGGALTALGQKGMQVFKDLLDVAGSFEQKMITLTAVLGKSVPAGTKQQMEEFAIKLGQYTPVSPNEAADVMNTLIRGGIKYKDVQYGIRTEVDKTTGAIKTYLDESRGAAYATIALAKANEMDLADASNVVIQAINMFADQELNAVDAVNIMTKTANASAVEVKDLGETMKNAGSAASIMGVPFEEFMMLAGQLGNVGIRGGEAGTALRYFFLNLIPTTQKSINLMKEYGLLVLDNARGQQMLTKAGIDYQNTEEGMLEGLWQMVGGQEQLGKSYAQAVEDAEPAVQKFQSWMVRQGVVTSKFVDTQTGHLKNARDIMKQLFETFGENDNMTDVQAAEAMGQLFGVRGGFKGAAPLFQAYRQQRKQIEGEIAAIQDQEKKRVISHAEAQRQINALEKEEGNIVDKLMADLESYGNAEEIMNERTKGWVGSNEYLNSSLEALKLVIGKPMLDTLSPLVKGIGDFINQITGWYQQLNKTNPELAKTISLLFAIVPAFAAVAGPLMLLSAAWPYVMSALSGMAAGILPVLGIMSLLGAVITAVVVAIQDPSLGIVPAIMSAAQHLSSLGETMRNIGQQVFQGILMPLGYLLALLFRDVMLPAVLAFADFLANNLPGAVATFSGVLTGTLVPAILDIISFVGTALPAVWNALVTIWSGVVAPVISGLASIFVTTLLPAIMQVADWFGTFLPVAVGILASLWQNVLGPVIAWVAMIIANYLIPVLIGAANWLGGILPPIIASLANIWQWLAPILEGFAYVLANIVIPAIWEVGSTIVGWLVPILNFIGDVLATLVGAWNNDWIGIKTTIEFVGGVIGAVIGFVWDVIKGLADAIGTLLQPIADAFHWLAGKAGEEGETAGTNYTKNIKVGIDNGMTDVRTGVTDTHGTLAALQPAAAEAGGLSGHDYIANIVGNIAQGMPELDAQVNAVKERLGAAVDAAKTIASLGNVGMSGPMGYNTWLLMQGKEGKSGVNSTANQNAYAAYAQSFKQASNTLIADQQRTLSSLEQGQNLLKSMNQGYGYMKPGPPKFNPWSVIQTQGNGLQFPGQNGGGPNGGGPNDTSDYKGGPLDSEYPRVPPGGGAGGGAGSQPSAAETAADLIKKVADGIKAGIEAMKLLLGMVIPKGVDQKAHEFAVEFNKIVQEIQNLALQYNSEEGLAVLAATSSYAEAGGKVADLLQKGIGAIASLKDWVKPQQASIDSFIETWRYIMAAFIKMASEWSAESIGQADIFADASSKAADTVAKGVDGFAKLDGLVTPAQASVDNFMQALRMVMNGLLTLSKEFDIQSQALVDAFSESAGKAGDAVSKLIDFVLKLAGNEADLGGLSGSVDTVIGYLHQIMKGLLTLVTGTEDKPAWTLENAALVGGVAEAGGKVADSLTKTVELLKVLADPAFSLTDVSAGVVTLVNNLIFMMDYLGWLISDREGHSGWTDKNALKVGVFSENASKVVDFLTKGVELLKALSNLSVDSAAVRAGIYTLADNLMAAMDEIGMLISPDSKTGRAGWTDQNAQHVGVWSENAAKVVDAVSKMLEFLQAAASTAKLGSTERVKMLAQFLVDTFTDFRDALTEAGVKLTEAGVTADALIGTEADTYGKVITVVGSTYELLEKLASADSTLRRNPAQYAAAVVGQLKDVLQAFRDKRDELKPLADQTTADLMTLVGQIVSAPSSAIDMLEKLYAFRPVSLKTIQSFMGSLRDAVDEFGKIATEIAPDLLDAAKAAGEKLAPAIDLLDKAVSFFINLTGTTDEEGKKQGGLRNIDPDAIGELTGKLWLTIQYLKRDLLDKIAPEVQSLASEFATRIGPAVDILNSALDLFIKLVPDKDGNGGLKQIDPNAIGALVGNLYLLLSHWRNLIIGGEFQGDFMERSAAFSSGIAGVLQSLNDVLQLAADIVKANESGAIDQLPQNIQKIADAMRAAATLTTPLINSEWTGLFTDLTTELQKQSNETIEGTIAYLWWGKQTGILWRMWQAVEGKNSLRPILRLAFEGLFSDIDTALYNWVTAVKPVWGQAMQDLVNSATNAINQIKSILTGITTSPITVSYTVTWDGPMLAAGGIVTRPTLAMVGEPGTGGEAIIPLNQADKYLGGGGNTGPSKVINNHWNIRSVEVKRTTDLEQESRRLRRQSTDNT